MGALPADEIGGFTALGELALDGSLTSVVGVLLAALAAASRGNGNLPGGEPDWAGEAEIVATPSLLAIVKKIGPPQLQSDPAHTSSLHHADIVNPMK